ncbi:MAG: hypothetical protein AAF636_11480 [Pseudomonadota bacterium]
MSSVIKDLNTSQQTALAGFKEFGVKPETLPQGVADVSATELRFVLELLKTGNMGQSALVANPNRTLESAQVWASKTLRKTKVFRLYSAALQTVSKDADKMVSRVYERSVLFHDKMKEASRRIECLKAKLVEMQAEQEQQNSEGLHVSKLHVKAMSNVKLELATAQSDETRYATQAHKQDMLLGSLLGKLNLNLNVNHQGEITHYSAGNEFTDEFARARREWEGKQNA